MRVLISGGSGFIGSYLTEALLGRGDQAVILTRNPSGKKERPGVQYVAWDDNLEAVVSRCDAVINMAGKNLFESRWNAQVKKEILSSRVETTRKLAEAIVRSDPKPRVFISFSATGYYGNRGDEPLRETSASGNDFLAEVCRKWEEAAVPVQKVGVRTVIPRIGIVKQKDDGALAKMLLPFQLFIGGPLGDGSQYYPWVHMDDVVGLLLHALDNPEVSGPMNVAAPEHGTMKEFAKSLGTVLHRPSLFPVPEFALRLVVGQAASAIVSSARVVPAVALQTGYQFKFTDRRQALRDILNLR